MVKLTQSERLAVLEEKVESVNAKLDMYFKESREFHNELIAKLEKLNDERYKVATLEERVKTNERMIWLALTAGVGSMVKVLFDVISNGGQL